MVAALGSVAPVASVLHANSTTASPNERLNLGFIGVGGWGATNLAALSSENIVALCDVDLTHAGQAKQAFPKAAVYQDFRRLLEHKGLDAVVISTPDHMHAIPAVQAMRMGMHVYCEQPLAHSVYEARMMYQTSVRSQVVTQCGVGTRHLPHLRRAAEIVRKGLLGSVDQVHVWHSGRPVTCTNATPAQVPATLDYNLWLGPAPHRPYSPDHCHKLWKYWWDFGGGTLAEHACLYFDLPFAALGLHFPEAVQAKGQKAKDAANTVPTSLQVQYEFTNWNGGRTHLYWYHGGLKPPFAQFANRPNGILLVGSRGRLFADLEYLEIHPEEEFQEHRLQPDDDASLDPQQEWVAAIKGRGSCLGNFEYSGALTEVVLLGNVAFRAGDRRLVWDAARMQFPDDPSNATAFLRRDYRDGWSL